ncbi:MAG TPA: gamma-glutamylcyclotransferase family protein [Segetibacter sp.]|jgi:gamma-glutamylcyclotransferase (GGCT)/AIG2-like uncharacterized protein YtfP
MKENLPHLFVYGSLRSGFRHPAYDYISRYFTLVGDAKVKGYLYDMGNYPVAAPTQDKAFIVGELYVLNNENEFSWAMAQLDDYEGINADEGEVAMYRREPVSVFINNATVDAWIYWYNGDVSNHPIVASGDVLQFIQQKSKI